MVPKNQVRLIAEIDQLDIFPPVPCVVPPPPSNGVNRLYSGSECPYSEVAPPPQLNRQGWRPLKGSPSLFHLFAPLLPYCHSRLN